MPDELFCLQSAGVANEVAGLAPLARASQTLLFLEILLLPLPMPAARNQNLIDCR